MKYGDLIPGRKILPERIRENREPYYAALKVADIEYQTGQYNVDQLSRYLGDLLKEQVEDREI